MREILGDDAEVPGYIATVPRRGYRFIAPVATTSGSAALGRSPGRRLLSWLLGLGGLVLLLLALATAYVNGARAVPAAEAKLAVLPLATPSGTEEDRLAAHVLFEELLVNLSARVPRLAVVNAAEAERAGEEARLEGSVYRVDRELSLTLRLVAPEDGATLWGHTFRQARGGSDWLAWPPEAAAAVARVVATASAEPAPARPQAAVDELAANERSFAGIASRHGVREAFLAYLAEDAVVFRPTPVPARPLYAALPPDGEELLSWEPVTAVVAASGELGYTTGPWSYWERAGTGEATAFGQFLSVWQRNAAGQWRLVADTGISHPEPTAPETWGPPAESAAVLVAAGEPASVERAEGAYCAALAGEGIAAFARLADPGVRLLRDGHQPARDREAALAVLGAAPAPSGCETTGSRTAASADLAATWGVGSLADDGRYAFLRVWQRRADEPWRLTVDLATTLPAVAS